MNPTKAGVIGSGRRRVPGLRREEVAFLAGVSVDYYVRMERGDLRGVSPAVLDALARALQLDEAETAYLHDLAAAAGPRSRRGPERPAPREVRPGLQRFMDAVTGAAVVVARQDTQMVAANPLGRALFAPVFEDPRGRGNTARFMFLSPAASRGLFVNWEQIADQIVASMRSRVGNHPLDRDLPELIGQLESGSVEFRERWAAHDVRFHRTGLKHFRHAAVGEMELPFEALELPDHPGWRMLAYTPEPGTPSAERLALLGSLAASAGSEDAVRR